MKRQYKIKETLGQFLVFTNYTETTKIWSWKEFRYTAFETEKWCRADIAGTPEVYTYLPPMKMCNSLEEAKQAILNLNTTPKTTWHDVEL